MTADDRQRLTPEAFAALAHASGIPVECLDPQEAAQATNDLNRSTGVQDQRDRITWSLSNLQLTVATDFG